MAYPDFLQFQCNNTGPECTSCPKSFIIPINSIEGIYRETDGSALILLRETHYLPFPTCCDKLRFVKTNATYQDIIIGLDGKIFDIGSITLIPKDHITKR